ncbi:MAG: SIMPL domain-containing protein [Geminicoccaceae bacterium]
MVQSKVNMILALGLLLGLGFTAMPVAAEEQSRRITVSGQGEAKAAPDVATMSIGVETEAKTPGLALSENAARMTAVMKQLKGAGIADKDMQTSQLGISPIHGDRQQPRTTIAYRVSNQLQVTIRAIDSLGAILDATVADGANAVNGPTFGIADPEPLLAAAQDEAVKDAIAKAERFAAAAGVELGEVISIDEGGGGPVFPRQGRMEAMAASTPVAAGESTLSANVTMTFAIDGGGR